MQPRKVRLWAAIAALGLLGLGLLALPSAFVIRVADLPRRQAAIAFVDRSGLPLGTILPPDRSRSVSVPLERISRPFLQAIVATEDARFFQHRGVDPLAVARAVRQLLQSGRAQSGASTITMQLARMLYGIPPTWRGKAREAWLATCIERGSTKSQVLEAYAGRLPMGGNLYGVESAAQTYFGTAASDLDLAQAALLAAIPNDPVHLNPRVHWRALKARQRYVLGRMVSAGYINAAQAATAFAEELHLAAPVRGLIAAPQLLFMLAARAPTNVAQIQTTLDRPLQRFIEAQLQAVLRTLASRNVRQGAAIVLDNASGEVLAYAGSADYFDASNGGQNDGVAALRQPGSALKPFLYQLALEHGDLLPNTILADVPTTYAVQNGQLYTPADYNNAYAGPVRVRVALANSLNVPAVRVLAQLGSDRFLERLHQLGFAHLTKSADYYGLGLTLGGGEVSLWELTRAYLTMARRGFAIPLQTMLAEPRAPPAAIGASQMWLLVTDMLSDPRARARSFGASSILDLPFATAVKTGTSSDFRDTWTVGFSSNYTVGVWVGNFNGAPMRHVSGVTGAAPLWNRIMLHLHEMRDAAPFQAPPGFVRRSICATTGWRPDRTCAAVVTEYLLPSELARYERSNSAPLPRDYDEWLAMQKTPAATRGDVRILFPHEADTFVLNLAPAKAVRLAPLQAILFQVRTLAHERVTWRLNGRYLATTLGPSLMWALRAGRWRLDVATAQRRDSVSFSVMAGKPHIRRGFSM